ncbi:riboflavin biosynthesis protein RibF [Companilactobacillus sp. DQM5]|uniref:riboflavin biosynthesis protein RibF n=1 Tax=Companilactobacillus sp. DQM5 TaxID=3463359 RepID=UPI0040586625
MKKINLIHPFNKSLIPNQPVVLALGFFDGVHLGHQQVIKTAKKIAEKNKQKLAVMTFNQSPSTVFGNDNEKDFRYLSTINRKANLFEKLGVDYMYIVDLSEDFIKLKPQEFVDQYIVNLNAKTVVAGFDYTYGPKEIANMTTLVTYANNRFDVVKVDKMEFSGQKIGTTSIKNNLKNNQLENANKQLGYIYENTGEVVHGFQRGRTLGYPTANIDIDKKEFIPGIGVYITEIKIDNIWYPSMTSVGFNITFDDVKDLVVESNILDFNKDIYGKKVTLKWRKFLRKEVKFDGIDKLIEQLDKDKIDTENYFKNNK